MTAKVIEAMLLIVRWAEMMELCKNRTSCDGCPYNLTKSCDVVSTNYVLKESASIFRTYINGKEKEDE